MGTKIHASAFKQNKRAGAWGAEYTLAQLLRAKGAEVRIVVLPAKLDGTKYGIDDLIAERGTHEVLKLIYNNWVVERDPDEALYHQTRGTIRIESTPELFRTAPARPVQVISKILPEGCVALLAGPAGIGKSFIALNACQAVATGGQFLDLLQAEKGKALYLQCEMPRWALAERIKNLGPISDNLLICSPGVSLPLNYWEPDGFNKRRETGNREAVMTLLDQIRAHSPKLVCFDALKDFTSVSTVDPDAAKNVFQIFRMFAQAARCGVLLLHHHRKTGGRDGKYEGQDDMVGSFQLSAEADTIMSLYAHTRSDGTRRYKLMFSKLRHAAPMEPVEIERLSGNESLSWTAVPWEDHTKTKVSDEDKVIRALERGGCEYKEVCERSRISKSTFYRVFGQLEKKGLVRRSGNVYFLADSEA